MQPPKHPDFAMPSTREWWACPGAVYFIGVGTPIIAIKIGMLAVTAQLTLQSAIARRVCQIQTSNHEPVQLLGVIGFHTGDFPTRDAETKERELHSQFSYLARFTPGTKGSEWFNIAPELLKSIEEIAVPPEALGLPRSFASRASSPEP